MRATWPTGFDADVCKALTHTWQVVKIQQRLTTITAALIYSLAAQAGANHCRGCSSQIPVLRRGPASFLATSREELSQRADKALHCRADCWKEAGRRFQFAEENLLRGGASISWFIFVFVFIFQVRAGWDFVDTRFRNG